MPSSTTTRVHSSGSHGWRCAYQLSRRSPIRSSAAGKRWPIWRRRKISVALVAVQVTATDVTSAAEKTSVMMRDGRLANGWRASARSGPRLLPDVPSCANAGISRVGIGWRTRRLEPGRTHGSLSAAAGARSFNARC